MKKSQSIELSIRNQTYTTIDGKTIKYDQEYFTIEDDKIVRYVLGVGLNGKIQFSTRESAEKWINESK